MTHPSYRYFLDMSCAEGAAALGQFEVNLDLDPVVEWGRFTALRRWPDPTLAAEAEVQVQPIWHAQAGAPYVAGLRATARANGELTAKADIPISYFKASAMRQGDILVSQKRLKSGDLFTYAVLAFPASEARNNEPANPLEIEDVPVPA